MSDISKVFTKMESKFDATAAAGFDAVFQFAIEDEFHHLIIEDQKCHAKVGEHDDPSVTLIMDETTFLELIQGKINGMQAFMSGKLKTEGNMMLATRLSDLFLF